MAERRYPTLEEFWKRLDVRDVEPDLRDKLRERTTREARAVHRVGDERTVVAVAARLIPSAMVPAKALAAFLDEMYDKQLGRGDDKAGLMPRSELTPTGFVALNAVARDEHGSDFADLTENEQNELLARAERGELPGPEGFDFATWFTRTHEFLLVGFGSDPRGMVEMGFPGPSYKPGHVWLDAGEVEGRDRRKPGYLEL